MYLVRKINKTGRMEVYELDSTEFNNRGHARRRKPRAWRFHKGIAAIDETVAACMLAIEIRENLSETLDA